MSRVPLPLAPDLPREIQLEVTGACNLRCRMCLVRYRPPLERVAGSMSFEEFRRVIDALPDLHTVTLQGLGEPLLAPDLFRMIDYAAGRGLRVGFNTNGTRLHRRAAERLVDGGLAWLCLSVDGARASTYEAIRDGARFEQVKENALGLVDVMRRRRATRPDLSIVFVAMRRNVAELPDMVRLAAAWRIPKLRVQNLSHSFDDVDPSDEGYRAIRDFTASEALWQRPSDAAAPGAPPDDDDARAAFAEARRVAAELGVTLRLPAMEPDPPPAQAKRARGDAGCDWPWRSAYVRHDGKAQPCCMVMGEDRAILGDLRDDPFDAVWRGPAYRELRAALLTDEAPEVCRGCSMYRGVF